MAIAQWTQATRGMHLLWLPIPAYSAIPILIWTMHMKLWTLIVALLVCATLGVLKLKGREVPWVIRRFRLRLRGGITYARPLWYRRRVQILDSFDLVDLRKFD